MSVVVLVVVFTVNLVLILDVARKFKFNAGEIILNIGIEWARMDLNISFICRRCRERRCDRRRKISMAGHRRPFQQVAGVHHGRFSHGNSSAKNIGQQLEPFQSVVKDGPIETVKIQIKLPRNCWRINCNQPSLARITELRPKIERLTKVHFFYFTADNGRRRGRGQRSWH